jgi:hypothetical protein
VAGKGGPCFSRGPRHVTDETIYRQGGGRLGVALSVHHLAGPLREWMQAFCPATHCTRSSSQDLDFIYCFFEEHSRRSSKSERFR